MAKIKFTPEELRGELVETIGIMLRAAESFDQGHHSEARVMAASLRLLLHDTGKSDSLLRLLNLASGDSRYNKSKMSFYNTCPDVNPRNLLPHQGFLVTHLSPKGAVYMAALDEFSGMVETPREPFKEWWTERTVFKDEVADTFTREELMKFMANKTGLAHVDPEVSEKLYRLSKLNAFGWKFVRESAAGKEVRDPENSPVNIAIRQITHELLKTLQEVLPDCFPRPYVASSLKDRTPGT